MSSLLAQPRGAAPPRAPDATPYRDTFPRWVLWAAGSVLLFTLVAVALVRITGNGPDQKLAPAAIERLLRFEDRPDGAVAVIDGETGRTLTHMQGEQGFLRGALRALARERKARGLGASQPFVLIGRTDGRLTLYDPTTTQRIDLEAFGPVNAGVFARLLTLQPDDGMPAPAAAR